MTWKKLSCVVRRLEFVKLALKAQQSMTELCRNFGFSRKSGYKWVARFELEGRRGLKDKIKRPHHSPRQISTRWLARIRRLRRRHWNWGSRKIAVRLRKEHPMEAPPSIRTIGKWLRRMGLSRRRRRRTPQGPLLKRQKLTVARGNNHVWTADFKGWFRTQDGKRVEPLTVGDLFSRYLLTVRLLDNQGWEPTRREFLRLFARYGYPEIIRVDNGKPFASNGPLGLSRLSAWWTALGIRVQFIAPGHPEQNAAHEQMHRVLKAEATRLPSSHRRAQQRRTARWIRTYNTIRPHQSLNDETPAELYRAQPKAPRSVKLTYPSCWVVRQVRSNGEIRWQGRKRFVGEAFAGYPVGLRSTRDPNRVKVYFASLLIGELWATDQSGLRPANYVRRRGRRFARR